MQKGNARSWQSQPDLANTLQQTCARVVGFIAGGSAGTSAPEMGLTHRFHTVVLQSQGQQPCPRRHYLNSVKQLKHLGEVGRVSGVLSTYQAENVFWAESCFGKSDRFLRNLNGSPCELTFFFFFFEIWLLPFEGWGMLSLNTPRHATGACGFACCRPVLAALSEEGSTSLYTAANVVQILSRRSFTSLSEGVE